MGCRQWNSEDMSWSPDTAFVEGLQFFSASVTLIRDNDWQRPSPCTEWTVLDVLGHVGTAVGFGTELLSGGQPEWSPSDPPGANIVGDPRSWWDGLVAPARQCDPGDVELTMEVDSPFGRRTIGDRVRVLPPWTSSSTDRDLARSVGSDVVIPTEAISSPTSPSDRSPKRRCAAPGCSGRLVGSPLPIPARAKVSSPGLAATLDGYRRRTGDPGLLIHVTSTRRSGAGGVKALRVYLDP